MSPAPKIRRVVLERGLPFSVPGAPPCAWNDHGDDRDNPEAVSTQEKSISGSGVRDPGIRGPKVRDALTTITRRVG